MWENAIEFLMEFLCLEFSKMFVGCRKKTKDLEGFGTFERSGTALFKDLAADFAGVGFKTEPSISHQINGMRISKTKEAHKS